MAKRNCNDCNRVRVGEPFDVKKDCRLCWLYHHDAGYREFYDAQPDRATDPPPPECGLLGDELTKEQRVSLGIAETDVRRWSCCDHPKKPLGPIVCPCRGCGPSCGGYQLAPTH